MTVSGAGRLSLVEEHAGPTAAALAEWLDQLGRGEENR